MVSPWGVLLGLLELGVEDGDSVIDILKLVDVAEVGDSERVELMSVVGSLLVVDVGIESRVDVRGGSEVGVCVDRRFVVTMVFITIGVGRGLGEVDITGTVG